MGAYKVGCLVPVRGTALQKQEYQVGVGALIATPGYILDLINAMDSDVVATDQDIWENTVQPAGANSAASKWYLATWAPFTDEWKRFKESHEGFFSRFWGATVESINNFRKRLIVIRQQFASIGGKLNTPAPRAPEASFYDELGNMVRGVGSFVKNIVYVLIAGVGGYILIKTFKTP